MHNCKKNGSKSKRESTIGIIKIIPTKKSNMPTKPLLSLKWDKFSKTRPPWKRRTWWTKWRITTRCLPKRRETESPNGSLTNKLRMLLKSKGPIWVILCKRISQQLNPNLPHTDSCHTTSRDLEKNKSKILLPKETNKSLMLRWHKRINAQRNINGPSKIYLILNINSITNLNFKINKNKPFPINVMLT